MKKMEVHDSAAAVISTESAVINSSSEDFEAN